MLGFKVEFLNFDINTFGKLLVQNRFYSLRIFTSCLHIKFIQKLYLRQLWISRKIQGGDNVFVKRIDVKIAEL